MAKQLIFREEARKKMTIGVNKVGDAVGITLGPKGQNVAMESPLGLPRVLQDGVSVAKEIELVDRFENMGAMLTKQAAVKTNEESGDGTTTSTILAQELVNRGMGLIAAGYNPKIIEKGIDRAVEAVVAEIKNLSKPVKKTDWEKVATISAQNSEIGKLVVQAVELIGEDGVIEVEENKEDKIEIEHKMGMVFKNGYVNPLFAKGSKNGIIEIKDAYVLTIDRKMNNMDQLTMFLDDFIKTSKDLVIVTEDVDIEVISTMILNKRRGILNVAVVKAPGFGDRKKVEIEDLAVVVGSTLISNESGIEVSQIELEHLGRADLVKITNKETTIVGGGGVKKDIEARALQIEAEIKEEGNEYEIKKLKERKAKLLSGVASILVGAATEAEQKNLIERAKDATGAIKAAIKSGIIPGGGTAFVRASKALDELETGHEDEVMGVRLVKKVLEMPIRRLAENSGEDAGWIYQEVKNNRDKVSDFGFNVMTGEFGNLIDLGVIEPSLVATSSLINAASVAKIILTTGCLIADAEKEKNV